MRRTYTLFATLVLLLTSALPAFAAEGDPLAEAVLMPGWFGFAMVGLAIVLILIFAALARRGTH
jgi:hypothetical protein